jgi:hypothetical protein
MAEPIDIDRRAPALRRPRRRGWTGPLSSTRSASYAAQDGTDDAWVMTLHRAKGWCDTAIRLRTMVAAKRRLPRRRAASKE